MRRFVRRFAIPFVLATSTATALAAQNPAPAAAAPERAVTAAPADVASIDAILTALYDVISGPAGQPRNWDRMRSLFIPGARLIPATMRAQDGTVRPRVLTVEDYITQVGPNLERGGFFEREISRKTESFGSVTQAFSTYESRRTAQDAKPFARGINSIQLLNDGQRWWVVTIYWDGERPNNPIPAKYLP